MRPLSRSRRSRLGYDNVLVDRIGSFSRVVDYDRRGSGISDRTVGAVPIEVEVEDLLAVLDAAGSERPYLFGFGVGGSLSLMFAAVHPDRCAGVIAYATPACFLRSDDYPYGWDRERFGLFLRLIEEGGLAGPESLSIIAPSMAGDLAGIAVHIGKRVCDIADAGEILVSRTLPDLVAGSGLEFEDRHEHVLRGVPGRWQIFAVRS